MAESVDALVSNTSGATHPGSIPGLGTETEKVEKLSPFSLYTTHAREHIIKGSAQSQAFIILNASQKHSYYFSKEDFSGKSFSRNSAIRLQSSSEVFSSSFIQNISGLYLRITLA